MSRLNTVAISTELRTSLKDTTFPTLALTSIPTGKDPRRLEESEDYPVAIVQICSSVINPKGIGGAAQAMHGLAVFLAFKYEDGEDINMLKLQYGEELFDWFCDNKVGSHYKLFMADGKGAPSLNYEPDEERPYLSSGRNIALIRLEAAIQESQVFLI